MDIQPISVSPPAAPQINPPGENVAVRNKPAQAQVEQAAQAVAAPPAQPAQPAPTDQQVKDAVKDIVEFASALTQNLQFSMDKESGKTIVKVVDSETKELIRQFPSEELVAISRALHRIEGLLLKQKA